MSMALHLKRTGLKIVSHHPRYIFGYGSWSVSAVAMVLFFSFAESCSMVDIFSSAATFRALIRDCFSSKRVSNPCRLSSLALFNSISLACNWSMLVCVVQALTDVDQFLPLCVHQPLQLGFLHVQRKHT